MDNLNNYIKEAFESKNKGDYKKAIDYFYKALALENDSSEIMFELAQLYSLLSQTDRALSLFEQIFSKNIENNEIKLQYALLLKRVKNYAKAEQYFTDLYNKDYELTQVGRELFEIYVYNKNYDKLIDTFNRKYNAIKDSLIFYYVGLAYENTERAQIAENFYQRAYEHDENNADAAARIASNLIENGNYEQAEKICLQIIKNSENDKIFAIIADIFAIKTDYDSAMKYYSYAIRLNDKNPEYYFKLGIAYTFKGYFKEAEASYCNAIDLEPSNIMYNWALAYLYYTIKKPQLAENIADTILSINPEYYDASALKALLMLDSNRCADCTPYIDILNKAENKSDFVYFVLAKYYSRINMNNKAIDYIKRAIKLKQDSIEYKYELATYLYNAKKDEEALEILKQIIEINPKYIEAYLLLSEIYLIKADYLRVEEITQTAIALDINSYKVYSIRGRMYYVRKMWDKAIENFKIAISICPQIEENYAYVGYSYYQLENYLDSYTYYKEASEINIANPEYFYYMAKCAQNLNQNENALAHYSIMYRLAPNEIEYITDYAEFLAQLKKKKNAVNIVKTLIKNTKNKEQIIKIKKVLEKIKK